MTMSFSVVMCNLDEIKYIKWSLTSLRNQTLRPKEIIVVDGGSTDGSFEVAQALGTKVYRPKMKGVGAQRLDGIFVSEGDFICSANSDTVYPRDYLENASRYLSDTAVKAVTGPSKPIPGTYFSPTAQIQGALSHFFHMTLATIYEHNVCFNKDAFIRSKLGLKGYWKESIVGHRSSDIGYLLRYELKPRWKKDVLVYTKLPTHGFSAKLSLGILLKYLNERGFARARLSDQKGI